MRAPRRRHSPGSRARPASRELLESIRRTFALDGAALWHRHEREWLVDAVAGAPAERGDGSVRVDETHELALAGPSDPRGRAAAPRRVRRGARRLDPDRGARGGRLGGRRPRARQRPAARHPLGRLARPPHAARRYQGVRDLPARRRDRLAARRAGGLPRDDRRRDGPARRPRREPPRHEPAADGRAQRVRRSHRARRGRPGGATEHRDRGPARSTWTSARRSRASWPMPASSSARSRTSSRTRSCTETARPSGSWRARSNGGVDLRVVDRGPGVPAGRARARLRAVPATRRQPAEVAASGSGSRSRAGSSRRWAARWSSRTRPAAGSPWSSGWRRRHDEDPRRRRRAADPARARCEPQGTRLRGRPRRDGRGGADARAATPPGRRDPRPRPSGHRRPRGDRGAARLDRRADRRALRSRARGRQGRGARRRRRRLRHEAVRDGRAARARARGAPPLDRRTRRRRSSRRRTSASISPRSA